MMSRLTREQKAEQIAQMQGAVTRINENTYSVKSQSGSGDYEVICGIFGFACSCPDHTYRSVKCKHIFAVEYSLKLREQVKANTVIAVLNLSACLFCTSKNIIKSGIRHNKHSGDIQRLYCKDCERYFTVNLGFAGMKAPAQVITAAMQLYFTGESLRNVQKFLRLQGYQGNHMTVYRWIKKYVKLMENYLEKIKPQVSDVWRTDEMYLKVSGNLKYLYAIMDGETRFWIAQQVAHTKYTEDVRPLFKEAREVAGKRPMTLISDGARNFEEVCRREYYTMAMPKTKHIRHIHISGDKNNNKIERLNDVVRDKEKTT
ncbi:DDE-type integrase/transposase/recombinase, partial [Nitrososphaera sp.]|uniref:DDE-type integrase/transposase/recombinase n=1 Tax=Nitrososphaera sp. TaxID=1971748 RepID=UPI002EDA0701